MNKDANNIQAQLLVRRFNTQKTSPHSLQVELDGVDSGVVITLGDLYYF